MTPTALLIVLLLLVAAAFVGYWIRMASAGRQGRAVFDAGHTAIGFVTNFFDTLGIGSYATSTATRDSSFGLAARSASSA